MQYRGWRVSIYNTLSTLANSGQDEKLIHGGLKMALGTGSLKN